MHLFLGCFYACLCHSWLSSIFGHHRTVQTCLVVMCLMCVFVCVSAYVHCWWGVHWLKWLRRVLFGKICMFVCERVFILWVWRAGCDEFLVDLTHLFLGCFCACLCIHVFVCVRKCVCVCALAYMVEESFTWQNSYICVWTGVSFFSVKSWKLWILPSK